MIRFFYYSAAAFVFLFLSSNDVLASARSDGGCSLSVNKTIRARETAGSDVRKSTPKERNKNHEKGSLIVWKL